MIFTECLCSWMNTTTQANFDGMCLIVIERVCLTVAGCVLFYDFLSFPLLYIPAHILIYYISVYA